MTLRLTQEEPGPVAIKAGIDSLLAGLKARTGLSWVVVAWPDLLKEELPEDEES